MWNWIKQLDRLLRGEATSLPVLRAGGLEVPVVGLALVIDLLGAIYGLCMGLFAVTGSGSGKWMQIPASMVKVPALFLLTLFVTLPSLYVFNGLVGSRLRFTATVRLLVASIAIMLAVLSSTGPIVAFFSVSTTSYPFMVLLNVVVFAIAGVLGLGFLLQTLHRLSVAHAFGAMLPLPQVELTKDEAKAPPSEPAGASDQSPLDLPDGHVMGRHVKKVFRIWLIVFALVGAQMGWVLRPFIGAPGSPFTFLRAKESNFFEAVAGNAWRLAWGQDAARGRSAE